MGLPGWCPRSRGFWTRSRRSRPGTPARSRCWTRVASAGRGWPISCGSGWASGRRCTGSRRIGGGAAERVLFALVAQRALAPGSKLAATRWVAERVAIADCPGFSDDSAYAAMDFLLDALGEIAAEIFDSVAHLLNLDVDIVFVDSPANRKFPLIG